MGVVILANNLSKKYKGCEALKNTSIRIEEGKFYVIMGRSGSGKTTLLSLLGLLDEKSSGELYINGREVSDMKEGEKANLRMKEFGFIFQQFYLNTQMKAYENVMVPMYINKSYKGVDFKKRSIELLKEIGLEDRCNYLAMNLSGGEQQRVAIARALANDPKVIFADEPTGNLDIQNEKKVFKCLKELTKQNKSVIVVSHNEAILEYADKVYIMSDGILKEQ